MSVSQAELPRSVRNQLAHMRQQDDYLRAAGWSLGPAIHNPLHVHLVDLVPGEAVREARGIDKIVELWAWLACASTALFLAAALLSLRSQIDWSALLFGGLLLMPWVGVLRQRARPDRQRRWAAAGAVVLGALALALFAPLVSATAEGVLALTLGMIAACALGAFAASPRDRVFAIVAWLAWALLLGLLAIWRQTLFGAAATAVDVTLVVSGLSSIALGATIVLRRVETRRTVAVTLCSLGIASPVIAAALCLLSNDRAVEIAVAAAFLLMACHTLGGLVLARLAWRRRWYRWLPNEIVAAPPGSRERFECALHWLHANGRVDDAYVAAWHAWINATSDDEQTAHATDAGIIAAPAPVPIERKRVNAPALRCDWREAVEDGN